ncbi:MAG: hypothetical protein RIQ41_416 [Candidatus Parcubacteria bacterium]|jgi:hypothetical protein
MKTIDSGHIYELEFLGSGTQTLTFLKRSGGAVSYDKEWDSVQTQEVLRALIERTKYLYSILPCVETQDAIHHLRMALFMYEVRAWRRKQEKVNRKEDEHDDSSHPRVWRDNPFDDVPFNEIDIELRPTGDDGHIIL